MNEPPEKTPWDDFQPVGGGAARPRPRTPWHTWLLLVVLTTAIGAGLGMLAVFWYQTGGAEATRREQRRMAERRVSEQQVRDWGRTGALAGGTVGLAFGLGVWARNAMGKGP